MSCSGAKRHLNRKLILETRTTTSDGAGGQVVGWATEGTLWAEVKAMNGSETRQSGRDLSRVRYQIFVRAAPVGSPRRPRPDQRFSENGRVFSILAVTEDNSDARYLRVWAEEGLRS